MLNAHLDWPHVGQVFRLERSRTTRDGTTVEVVYGITSLGPEAADAAVLLRRVRDHWGIENRLHHVRDVTLGEDACRARTGHEPQNLAAIRNATLTLLLDSPIPNRAAALRRHAARYEEALSLVQQSKAEN